MLAPTPADATMAAFDSVARSPRLSEFLVERETMELCAQ